MDLTQEQIKAEFERQVKLCSGIGFIDQFKIVMKQWKIKKWHCDLINDDGSKIGFSGSTEA